MVICGGCGGSAPRHALAAAGASVPLQAPPHIHKVPAIEVLGQARACARGARLVQGRGWERGGGKTAAALLLVTAGCKGVTARSLPGKRPSACGVMSDGWAGGISANLPGGLSGHTRRNRQGGPEIGQAKPMQPSKFYARGAVRAGRQSEAVLRQLSGACMRGGRCVRGTRRQRFMLGTSQGEEAANYRRSSEAGLTAEVVAA